MSTIVLVHGAWQTAGTWDLVAPKLRARGHSVTVPPLTGLENEEGQLSPSIELTTHIDDVVTALDRGNLRDVILVGHSYAGMIITGVAERAPSWLRRLVYVDAFVPSDGQSAMDLLPDGIAQKLRTQARSAGDGWRPAAGERELDLWGLDPGPERAFVRTRLSDFSLRCFEESIRLPRNWAAKLQRTYIACSAGSYLVRPVIKNLGDWAEQEGWTYHELPTGHFCHVEMPDAFVSKLLEDEGRNSGKT
jgi:pimeloyl-ACP methyl ester carboxylesterase